MEIKYRELGDVLIFSSQVGKAEVTTNLSGEIKVKGEKVLRELGISVGDAIAMYFDRTTNKDVKDMYPRYLGRKKQ